MPAASPSSSIPARTVRCPITGAHLRPSASRCGQPRIAHDPAISLCPIAMLVSMLLTGCTTVIVHSEGEVIVQRHLGVVNIVFDEKRTTAAALSSLGVTSLPGTFTLGWTDWKVVVVGQENADRCLFIGFSHQPVFKE